MRAAPASCRAGVLQVFGVGLGMLLALRWGALQVGLEHLGPCQPPIQVVGVPRAPGLLRVVSPPRSPFQSCPFSPRRLSAVSAL